MFGLSEGEVAAAVRGEKLARQSYEKGQEQMKKAEAGEVHEVVDYVKETIPSLLLLTKLGIDKGWYLPGVVVKRGEEDKVTISFMDERKNRVRVSLVPGLVGSRFEYKDDLGKDMDMSVTKGNLDDEVFLKKYVVDSLTKADEVMIPWFAKVAESQGAEVTVGI